jgi:hypothetical protein
LLLLAVNEIPKPNRTPQQRSKEKTCAKHFGFRIPPKRDFVRSLPKWLNQLPVWSLRNSNCGVLARATSELKAARAGRCA